MNLKKFLVEVVLKKNIHFRRGQFIRHHTIYNSINIAIIPACEDQDTIITVYNHSKSYETTIPEFWLKNWKLY